MTPNKPKVLLGMSGGVDSSASAVLLLEQGYEVIGAFMKNWSGTACEDGSFTECGWKDERRDAMRVAGQLGIPFDTFDFEEDYRRDVVENLFRETAAGRTPNPDVLCNKFVKFDLFVREADRLACDFVATGHYARIENGQMLAGTDPNKDQTYFLWAINPAIVPRILFPVGGMRKSDVREKARQVGLPTAEKKDSTGMCFVGEVDMRAFLRARLPDEPGKIVTTEGKVIGDHPGVHLFTIGQRHGIDVGGAGLPYYVVEKRPATRELIVASQSHPSLYRDTLEGIQANWFSGSPPFQGGVRGGRLPLKCQARIRYRQPLEACTIESVEDEQVAVRFDRPQRAVTPGQSIVFYEREEMLGGAIIA